LLRNKEGEKVLPAKFKPLVIKFLDYYPVAATILSLAVSVGSLAGGNKLIEESGICGAGAPGRRH